MPSDTPFWNDLGRVSDWARFLTIGVIVFALMAAAAAAISKIFDMRKSTLTTFRNGPGARHVPADLVGQMTPWLQPYQGTEIHLLVVANSPEALAFRGELAQLFQGAGWIVNPGGNGQMPQNQGWQQIEVVYYTNDIQPAVDAVIRTLLRLGYSYTALPTPVAQGGPFNLGTIVLRVGHRPQ